MALFGPVLREPAGGAPPLDVLVNDAGQAMIVGDAGGPAEAGLRAAPPTLRLVPRGGRLAVALPDGCVLGWAASTAEPDLLLARSVHLGVRTGHAIHEVGRCRVSWEG